MASALEHYVNNVRTLTSAGNISFAMIFAFFLRKIIFLTLILFAGNFRELVEYLNDSSELLSKNNNILDNVLETLDIQQHSLGVLYILVAKISEIQVVSDESMLHGHYIKCYKTLVFRFRTKIPSRSCSWSSDS